MNLRAGYTEDTTENTARYINGLRLEILDEISILSPKDIEEAYQSVMKAERKLLEGIMPREDKEPAGEKASHMAEAGLLVATRKVAVPKLPDQQIEVIV